MKPINRKFYKRHPTKVAKGLLGKLLVRKLNKKTIYGKIVETEAYSSDDPASHSYRGTTERNKIMFGEVGYAYVYFTYGNHFCLNVTAKGFEPAGAVLIRAVEPIEGIKIMEKLRNTNDVRNLTSGPGKLTRAFFIDKRFNGIDMTKEGELFIANRKVEDLKIKTTPRIGISSAQKKLWRFIIEGNKFVSKQNLRIK